MTARFKTALANPAAASPHLLLIELNEMNFDAVRAYITRGELPTFARLIAQHGVIETTSETRYEELEPWIQWVTAHTGLTFAEHGIFRLGDIVDYDLPQIWEQLEAAGWRVGAVSPMNAKNRLTDAAFFLPDPWTDTRVSIGQTQRRMYAAIAQAVNDNARSRMTMRSAIDLAIGGMMSAAPQNYARYVMMVRNVRRRPWSRALFLDLLLADIFTQAVRRTRPHFASLFLNAAAHIQHHYLFSSAVYSGEFANPDWYVTAGVDPVLDVYRLYDDILSALIARFPTTRFLLATGLHQDPHHATTFYWRLTDPSAVLRQSGIAFERVEPRMSRDFRVVCADIAEAAATERQLAAITASDGTSLFNVDNRGTDLFVELVYEKDIAPGLTFGADGAALGALRAAVAFVAIKNGRHNGIGYLVDTAEAVAPGTTIELRALHGRILAAFGVA